MQWCGVPSLRVSAVDIIRREQPLYARQVALLGGLEQSSVAPQQIRHVLVALLHQVQRRVAVTVLLVRVCPVLQEQGLVGAGLDINFLNHLSVGQV
jgi:hypothetical protein